MQIKPVSDIIRRPRSIFARGDFKANEFRSLLLYFLRFALQGSLDTKYIQHFQLLSAAVYTLSKEKISAHEIDTAHSKLNRFADEYEVLYGKHYVTMNIHLIRHLAVVVKHLGPLWVHTAFAFEANNGIVISANNSTKDIVHQLAWKYTMKRTIKLQEEKTTEFVLNGKKTIFINDTVASLFQSQKIVLQPRNAAEIYRSVVYRRKKFTSELSKEISTIDYFVRLNDNSFGMVQFYIVFDSTVFILINLFESIETIDHFIRVKRTSEQKLIKINELSDKMLYLKFGLSEYITNFPNKFEKT